MSLIPSLLIVATAGGIAPAEMRAIVGDRLDRLDRLVIDITSEIYTAPLGSSALDSSRWKPFGIPAPGRAVIVRPGMLYHDLRDNPERGYVPVAISTTDGRYVSEHVRPTKLGTTVYSIVEGDVQGGIFHAQPLLQFCDIHLQDSTIPQLNISGLFSEYDVQLVRGDSEMSTYTVSVPMHAYTMHCDFDLNTRGTPLRFRTVIEFPSIGEAPRWPATWEMFTLATQEVNGAELVTEAVVSILNPNVIAKASINHYGVHHLQVTSVVVDDTLTPADVRIEPRLRDARVNTHRRDGTAVHRTYDSAGNITQEQVTGSAVPPADETAHLVPRDSLRWRIAVPAAAAVAAVGACVMLAFVARRR